MKVLLLSPYPEALLPALATETVMFRGKRDTEWVNPWDGDFVISYGYRRILPPPVLARYKDRIINIHTGYLPFNRGAHPNFWSWYDDTPKGVTIHHMDAGIDTGDIIVQWHTGFKQEETLASSYQRLHESAVNVFGHFWPRIKHGEFPRLPQEGQGSFHYKRDLEKIWDTLPAGWNTPVEWVMEQGRKARGEKNGAKHQGTGA